MKPLNILFVILTYKRPSITALSIKTLLENTDITPNNIYILDDGSGKDYQQKLFDFAHAQTKSNINVSFRTKNLGVGFSFEEAYKIIEMHEPDIAVLVESDYVWRKGWLEDVISVYNANEYVVGIPGTSHPDMYERNKTHGSFIKLMQEQWGEDVQSRENMYQPFDLNIGNDTIKVQGVSNSCGCNVIFWNRWVNILNSFGHMEIYRYWMDRAFHKWGGEPWGRSRASDAHMTGTITYLWEKWALLNNIDIKKNFAWLDICDYTIAQHVCGGEDSINGKIVPEGATFIISPKWSNDYLNENPRKSRKV